MLKICQQMMLFRIYLLLFIVERDTWSWPLFIKIDWRDAIIGFLGQHCMTSWNLHGSEDWRRRKSMTLDISYCRHLDWIRRSCLDTANSRGKCLANIPFPLSKEIEKIQLHIQFRSLNDLWSAKQREGALSRNAPDIGSIFVVENYAFNPELNLVPSLQSRAVCKVEIILQENK